MSASETIQTQLSDGILSITMNRPEKKNALTHDMYRGLVNALEELENNPEARVGFITGTRECFTAGNDLADFLNNPPEQGSQPPVFQYIKKLPTLSKPLVAAINGPVIGVGVTMLLHCDLVYAATDSKLQMPFASLGACPEAGSSVLLPRLMGYQRAAQLLMLSDFFSAQEGKEWGLINDVFSPDEYQEKAYEQAKRLALQPASSLRVTKMMLRKAQREELDAIMDLEIEYFSKMLQSPEAKEALNAFMEKRTPDFTQFN
ncbi:MAG: enoyl-CoA hydratase [Gammaproteobacteria bacterium]|nr:MAG: enoyl-CoA hydratase [Gammaproteobacteria bacterium]